MSSLKARENRLRRKAQRLGFRFSKMRTRDRDAPSYGRYQLGDENNWLRAGYDGKLDRRNGWHDLEEIESFLYDRD